MLTKKTGDGSLSCTYDEKGRVLTQVYEDGDAVSYRYDNDGALATRTDSATGRTMTYYYDLIGRPMRYVEQGEDFFHSVTYTYNEDNNLSQTVEVINGVSRKTGDGSAKDRGRFCVLTRFAELCFNW